ncbi:MAG: peptide-N-glycosidase F-related protein [Candidatus Eisenbacteria bacterium]|nr:peptide-N-glycosidase F-related protein [Candidatus Eisenbacteria bacterium]
MRLPRVLLPIVLLGLVRTDAAAAPPAASLPPPLHRTIHVFDNAMIHFLPDSAARFGPPGIEHQDNGRRVRRRVNLGRPVLSNRLIAHLVVQPIPKTEASVCDPWDRAGSIRLIRPKEVDIEVVKFITSYGGRMEQNVDVTELGPILQGEVTFEAFIDTWVSPGWRVDLHLEVRPFPAPATTLEATFDSAAAARAPRWIQSILCEDGWTAATNDSLSAPHAVTIPRDGKRIVLRLLTSGHCTDGRDDDEFVTKDHVVLVDGREVTRFRPWRDDCRRFRDLNPYGRRWSDGSWSSDYGRSGWCPGDVVTPREIDLSTVLPPGPHTVAIRIEEIRPAGADKHFGYWRVSAALLGFDE